MKEIPQPEVKAPCLLCLRALVARGWATSHLAVRPPAVSPLGIGHEGADFGRTLCGKDATGDRWWWRL